MKKSPLLMSSAVSVLFATSAFAGEVTPLQDSPNLTVEQASQYLHYSGGNDRYRVEIAPNYSEELGFSLKGAVGGYLTDAMALGLIVEYGENKREYLANAGIQFNDALSFVGTVGMLEEHNEYVDGEDREEVQQMEYGASFKGAYEIGFLSGFELNGYLADADADSDGVETGKLYGVQLLTDLDLTDTTHVKFGGGYEWLEWDDTNEDDNGWTFSAEAAQQIGDVISLTGNAKLGASEFVYGGGLAFDLSNGGANTNTLGVNYSYIDGKSGIEDDQRVELSWSIGFGAGPTTSVAAADLTDKSGTIRAAADVAMVSPANNLLSDVMKRPAFLPERVLARAKADSVQPILGCQASGIDVRADLSLSPDTISVFPSPPSGGVLNFSIAGSVEGDVVSVEGVPMSRPIGLWFGLFEGSLFVVGNQYTLNYNGTACYVRAVEGIE